MKILVVGGSGSIGGHLFEFLKKTQNLHLIQKTHILKMVIF